MDFSNTFPVEVTGTVAFDRLDGVLYRDTLVLPAGSVPQDLTGEGTLSIPVNAEMLMPGGTSKSSCGSTRLGRSRSQGMNLCGCKAVWKEPN